MSIVAFDDAFSPSPLTVPTLTVSAWSLPPMMTKPQFSFLLRRSSCKLRISFGILAREKEAKRKRRFDLAA